MRFTIICFFIIGSLSFCSAGKVEDDYSSQLANARFLSDHLKEHRRALKLYKQIVSSLAKAERDSLQLEVEMERISLLHRAGESTELLRSLNSGLSLAQKLEDYERVSSLQYIKGFVYTQLGFKLEAVRILDQADENASKIKDWDMKSLNVGYATGSRAYTTDSPEERSLYFVKSYKHFMRVRKMSPHYRKAQISGNSNYASAFIELGQLDSAEHYLSLAISHIDPTILDPDNHYAVLNFASLYRAKRDYAESEKWLLSALKQAEADRNMQRQTAILYRLYHNQLQQGDKSQANRYLGQYARINSNHESARLTNISFIEKELKLRSSMLVEKASKKETFLELTLTGVILLLSISVGSFFFTRDRDVQRGYDHGLSKKYTAPAEREVTVEEIKNLNDLVKQGDPLFMMKFHRCFPSFSERLNSVAQQPLNYSEIEICAITKLNFTTKDIALYRKFSIRSVENRKYRIRKKLMLSPDTDFINWVSRI